MRRYYSGVCDNFFNSHMEAKYATEKELKRRRQREANKIVDAYQNLLQAYKIYQDAVDNFYNKYIEPSSDSIEEDMDEMDIEDMDEVDIEDILECLKTFCN